MLTAIDATVTGIVFLSFSDSLLLAYKNTIDFCMLILHPSIFSKFIDLS